MSRDRVAFRSLLERISSALPPVTLRTPSSGPAPRVDAGRRRVSIVLGLVTLFLEAPPEEVDALLTVCALGGEEAALEFAREHRLSLSPASPTFVDNTRALPGYRPRAHVVRPRKRGR